MHGPHHSFPTSVPASSLTGIRRKNLSQKIPATDEEDNLKEWYKPLQGTARRNRLMLHKAA
jgi:hypothetical protein